MAQSKPVCIVDCPLLKEGHDSGGFKMSPTHGPESFVSPWLTGLSLHELAFPTFMNSSYQRGLGRFFCILQFFPSKAPHASLAAGGGGQPFLWHALQAI